MSDPDDKERVWLRYPIDELLGLEGDRSKPLRPLLALQNPIHPLFAPDKFRSVQYDAIKPTLQLATQLIDTPCLMQYWHASLVGKLRKVPYVDRPGFFWATSRKGSSLTPQEVSATRRRLRILVPYINFKLCDSGDSHGVATGKEKRKLRFRPYHGFGSEIEVSRKWHDRIHALYYRKSTLNAEGEETLLRLYLSLATTICHEVAHAAQNARFGNRMVGFEDQPFSEEGCDWEFSVFGGRLNLDYKDSVGIVQWPSAKTFECYLQSDGDSGLFVAQEPPSRCEVVWRVPPRWIRKLFQQSFWQEIVAEKGVDALKPPRVLGYRTLPAAERGSCHCFGCRYYVENVKAHRQRRNSVDLENTHAYQAFEAERRVLQTHYKAEVTGCKDVQVSVSMMALHERLVRGDELSALNEGWEDVETGSPTVEEAYTLEIAPCRDYPHKVLKLDPNWDHCKRLFWGYWPGRDSNAYLDSFDPQTYGVPAGYAVTSDGSLVAEEFAERIAEFEKAGR